MPEEYFDILDEQGNPTGEKRSRFEAHSQGLWHRVVRIYLFRKVKNKIEFLVHLRSKTKDLSPNTWDTRFGGHLKSGEKIEDALVIEIKDEIGLELKPDNFIQGETQKADKFPNREFTAVYYHNYTDGLEKLKFDDGEVQEVKWMSSDDIIKSMQEEPSDWSGNVRGFTRILKFLANNDLKSTYNRIAEDWFRDHQEDTWWVNGTDKFISLLKPGSLVLDVGCGAGVKSKYLLMKGLKVIGIDFSEKMIEIARREVPDVKFLIADITEPIKLKEKFDGIFVQAVLLHIPKQEVKRVLDNLTNLLRPKGYLYVAVKGLKKGQPEEQIIKENDYGYEYERFFSFYTPEELHEYIKKPEIKIVYEDTVSVGDTNWIQVISQK